jgi:ABC-2 type transport system permease protein
MTEEQKTEKDWIDILVELVFVKGKNFFFSDALQPFRSLLKGIWTITRCDLLCWLRAPMMVICAIIPPLGMAILLYVLTLSVGKQPVALVIEDPGPGAQYIARIIGSDEEAYWLTITNAKNAERMLADQEVAAIITIPKNFDDVVYTSGANIYLTINNVDIDFADDLRRTVERSASSFDAPQVGMPEPDKRDDRIRPNPYLVTIFEKDLRVTNVSFLNYQIIPVFILLILSIGLMGTAMLCSQDRERGTAHYISVTPQPQFVMIAGRLLSGLIVSFIFLIPLLIFCNALGIVAPPADHWTLLIALFCATSLSASGIGAIVGSLLRGMKIVTMLSSIIATYLFFLGGGFTTIAFLPVWLQNISALNPIRYAIDGLRQILFYPDITGITKDFAVLLGTACCAIIIGSLALRQSWRK